MPILSITATKSVATASQDYVEVNIPIDKMNRLPIYIWKVQWIGDAPATTKKVYLNLAFQQVVYTVGLENTDVIAECYNAYTLTDSNQLKTSHESFCVNFPAPLMIVKDKLYVGAYHDKGSNMTVGVRIWYTAGKKAVEVADWISLYTGN